MVRHLLIGGQACVLYGAAEFSRDCDLVILADSENLRNLQAALAQGVSDVGDTGGTAAAIPWQRCSCSSGASVAAFCGCSGPGANRVPAES